MVSKLEQQIKIHAEVVGRSERLQLFRSKNCTAVTVFGQKWLHGRQAEKTCVQLRSDRKVPKVSEIFFLQLAFTKLNYLLWRDGGRDGVMEGWRGCFNILRPDKYNIVLESEIEVEEVLFLTN